MRTSRNRGIAGGGLLPGVVSAVMSVWLSHEHGVSWWATQECRLFLFNVSSPLKTLGNLRIASSLSL